MHQCMCAFLRSSKGPVIAFINFFILTSCTVQKCLRVVQHVEKVFDLRVQDFIYMWIDQESAFVSICWTFFTFLLYYFFALFLELFD